MLCTLNILQHHNVEIGIQLNHKFRSCCLQVLSTVLHTGWITWIPVVTEGVLGSRGISPRILKPDTGWRWEVSFTPPPLYLRRKGPRCTNGRRMGGPQRRSGSGDEEKKNVITSPAGIWTPAVQPVAQSLSQLPRHWVIKCISINCRLFNNAISIDLVV
jgi:hypothetical protein